MSDKRIIDEVDYKILEILQEKARIPNVEVARQVGMAPSAVLERIRKLEERGIIDGYEVRLNPQAFSLGLLAFVQVRVQGRLGADLAQQLARVTGVQEVHLIAGDDGYLLRLRVADHAELGQILTSEINALDGVLQTKTSVVLETIKDTEKLDLERF